MADLRKKFMDILFEDEEDDYQPDNIFEDSKKSKPENDSPIRAKDILYRKPSTSAFIDLEEKPKESYTANSDARIEEKHEVYEMSSQISPIFGLIKEKKKKVAQKSPEVVDTLTNRPADSHLDIITSPIYGYGNKEDARLNDYEVKDITNDDEEELHQLFDNDAQLEKSYEEYEKREDEEISLLKLFGDNK